MAHAGIRLGIMLKEANIDRSTWSRWRSNGNSPRLKNWQAALAATDKLTAEASALNTPAPDSTAAHVGASSLDPIPDTAQSQPASESPRRASVCKAEG
jgi:hypothetical protein